MTSYLLLGGNYLNSRERTRPNKAFHRTLVNVAKIRDYNSLFRVAEDSAIVVERR